MSKTIKIVEFVTRLEFGGVEAMLLNYTTHFKNPERFDLHIVTQDINDANCVHQFEENGYTVHIVTHKRKSILKNVREIYRIMRKEKFDVAHSHMTLTNFYVLFIAKMVGVPVRISHAHNAFKDKGLKATLVYPILKMLNRLSSNVWMTCGHEAGVFLYGDKAVRQSKVYFAHNAIDLQKFRTDEEARKRIRSQYGIGDAFCVGHIGRFMIQKNHEFLIEIFSELLKMKPDAKLLLVGDGELREKISGQINERRLGEKVVFTGNVTNTHELYQAMDIFVLPSLFEGLPVVSVEAQAVGLCCLISDKVDRRCAIIPTVQFVSIEEPAREWATAILDGSMKTNRYASASLLKEAGYDIDIEAEKLEKIYLTGAS